MGQDENVRSTVLINGGEALSMLDGEAKQRWANA
jgi:hypothetical protein